MSPKRRAIWPRSARVGRARNTMHEWPSSTSASDLWRPPNGRRWADGCTHVFLDVGMNIGVQTRKLFEPEKYPLLSNGTTASDSIIRQARHARSSFLDAFTTELGEDRSRNTCVFGFEANPFHTARLQALQSRAM